MSTRRPLRARQEAAAWSGKGGLVAGTASWALAARRTGLGGAGNAGDGDAASSEEGAEGGAALLALLADLAVLLRRRLGRGRHGRRRGNFVQPSPRTHSRLSAFGR